MKDLTTIKRPKKIHDRDVYSIRTETGQELAASLLSQAEYNYVVKYAKKKHPTNTKLSRKEHPLSYSVVFDEKGQPFVLYRGKSVAAQVKQNLFPPEQVPTLMSRWDFGQEKLLGEGSFGRVKISQNMHTGQWGAVKIILTERPDIDPSVLDFNIQRERFFLSKYKRMWGYAARTGATRKRYLFQSLIEGEQLWDWVARDVPSQRIWPECDQMRLNIAEKTTAALEECHKKAILHRDVKLENFLVDPHTQEVALIDFGLSRTSEQGLSLESSSLVGTKAYQAPELAQIGLGRFTYNEQTEAYALGWVLGAILLGPEFCTDFGYYSDRALNEMGYNRYADFLKRGAPKGLAAKSPAKQGEWAQESVYSPQRCPLARLCLEATQSATLSKPSSTISKEKLLWYQLIGELLSPNPAQRPSLKNVQRRLKKLNKSVLIASGQDDPSFSSQLLGCFKRSKKIPERPTPSLKHSKPSAGIR